MVCPDMPFEATLLSRAIWAGSTSIGFFSRVSAYMPFQIVFLSCSKRAVWAGEGLFPCVSVDVSDKVGGFNGRVGTVRTAVDLGVGDLSGVHGGHLATSLKPYL